MRSRTTCFLIATLLFTSLAAAPDVVTAQAPISPFRLVGYYAGYSIYEDYFVTDIRASRLTHLNYAHVAISPAGQCVSSDTWTDTQFPYPGDDNYLALRGNFRQLQLMRANYPNLKIAFTIGGWDYSDRFSDVARTDESRRRFVGSCIGFMRQYLFDGIDIDWRYPVSGGRTPGLPEDRENFTRLMAEFRTQLDQVSATDNKPYHLTMLAPAIPALYENIELDRIHPYVDWLNLMTFGYQGEWSDLASHHAPLYGSKHDPRGRYVQQYFNVDGTIQTYIDQGVPAGKLVVGVGLYAQTWQNVKAHNFFGLYQPGDGVPAGTRPGGILYYRDMLPLLQNDAYLQFYDVETQVPWMYSEQERIAISYENDQSVRSKAAYARENQLGGLMIWQLNFDDTTQSLVEIAYRALFLQ